MNAVRSGLAVPPATLQRLAATRSLPQIVRLLRDSGPQAIGCDGVCLLLRQNGALKAAGCAGIDPHLAAGLADPDGPAALAISEGRLVVLPLGSGTAQGSLVVVPFDGPALCGALVGRWSGSPDDAQRRATERLADAVADALNGAELMDCLPHLFFTLHPGRAFEPLGRLWRQYGLDPDEGPPSPRRLLRALHPAERGAVARAFRAAIRDGTRLELEHRLRRSDGSFRWVCTRAAPIGADPPGDGSPGDGSPGDGLERVVAFVGTSTEVDALVRAADAERLRREAVERRLTDEITDRGRTEARLAKAERIEAVGQLTSGVAHDFNNLLTVIIGNIEFLENAADGPNDLHGRARDRLAAMREAAERGGNLTRQLLAFARRQRLEPRPTDLNQVVAELRGLLPSATGGGIEVETRLQDGVWPALVDRTQIERMILNLAFNAHDSMKVGGTVTIGTRNSAVGAEEAEAIGLPGAGDYVEISVSDTGRGMDAAVMARAFEPFFTTKPPGKGSGLGLAQVYGFARQSGGIVTLQSAPGEGTRAAILLPRAPSAPATGAGAASARPAALRASPPIAIPPLPGPAPAEAAPVPSRLVLLVDDDLAVREVTSTIVGEAGYRVVEAAGGAEALERLAELGPVDLMVTDYAMPGMNGFELSRAAAERQPGLKVLFVTGYADLTALAEVPERRILLKPFRAASLLDKIAGVLAG